MTEISESAHGASSKPSVHKRGVKVERINTTPGVHPYDEVTWEPRDVVQQNWKTGETVFEQRGVEFPDFWSVNASTIVTTKYFRGAAGSDTRERSLKQLLDRVVLTYAKAGKEHGYFAQRPGRRDLRARADLGPPPPGLQLQLAGLVQRRDARAPAGLRVLHPRGRRHDGLDPQLVPRGGPDLQGRLRRRPQPLAASGRSKELLSSGGTASGPVSFMRGADASAGTIKSGGATRRAAKMVVLDVDHPDIEEFIETKWREEDKIRALRDAGYDMDLGGKDITSVQYQNANNSIRVTDEFMRAVEDGTEFGLRGRKTGEVIETVDARTLWDKIAQAAWACADPGIQYDDTINDWHTNPETGRITASNPCSEYMSLDNSSCNLASLNLLKFLKDDDTFDGAKFAKTVELVITAMDISICFADFPTEAIGDTTRKYRQLGIGYANLGALLMATGLAYDSDGGRALAGAITSLMTGTAYKRVGRDRRRRRAVRGLRAQRRGARTRHAQARIGQRRRAQRDVARQGRAPPRDQGVGRRQQAGGEERLAQRAGLGPRAHRHHRLHDGLRHHGHRAGLLVGEVQEARRRRLDADRQPDDPAGAAQARLRRGDRRGDRRVHRREGSRRRRARPAPGALRHLRLRDGRARRSRRWATCG